jgi:hypothetical protein
VCDYKSNRCIKNRARQQAEDFFSLSQTTLANARGSLILNTQMLKMSKSRDYYSCDNYNPAPDFTAKEEMINWSFPLQYLYKSTFATNLHRIKATSKVLFRLECITIKYL